MSGDRSSTVARLIRVLSVGAALALVSAGCGAVEAGSSDGGRTPPRTESIRADEVMSRLQVVPIAREAIQEALPSKEVTDVGCTSDLMYVSEGSVTQCTARIDGVPSGWTLTFRDASGAHRLTRRQGPPWKFATP